MIRTTYLYVLDFSTGTVYKQDVPFNDSESAVDYIHDVMGITGAYEFMLTENGEVETL